MREDNDSEVEGLNTYTKFRGEVLKLNKPRLHKVRNSLGIYDAYKYIRKNKWFDIGRPLTEHQFYTIIRQINNLLAEELLRGNDITLPHRLGRIELRKYSAKVYIDNGVLKTNLPINWNKTLKLWFEDEEAYKKRTLIKEEEKEIFKIFYNKGRANYQNKGFYSFEANRDLKRRLKYNIKNGRIDAFSI